MKIKSISFTLFALITVLLASCTPEDVSFDSSLLIGKWYGYNSDGHLEVYRYDSGGTGVSWVPADDVRESEAQSYEWILDKSDLTHIYILESGEPTVPMIYTVVELTSTTLKYKDDFGKIYTYTKMQDVLDSTMLLGKWSRSYSSGGVTKTEYYRYDSNGTAIKWVPEDGESESGSQSFPWELNLSDLIFNNDSDANRKVYTVIKLTSDTLECIDSSSTTYTFTKVQ